MYNDNLHYRCQLLSRKLLRGTCIIISPERKDQRHIGIPIDVMDTHIYFGVLFLHEYTRTKPFM